MPDYNDASDYDGLEMATQTCKRPKGAKGDPAVKTNATHTPAWAKGMQKIGPGIYIDGSSFHVSEKEICEHMGVPYTEENARIIEEVVPQAIREVFGECPPGQIDRHGETVKKGLSA